MGTDTAYRLIRSSRKTISVELRDGEVVVRAPMRTTRREADAFVHRHERWIQQQREKDALRREVEDAAEKLSDEEISALYERARAYIPARVAYYARQMSLSYNRVTIRCQRTRWGSCSAKRNLNFNCLLMLAPPEVIDAVVVHELCHLCEMNHSERFYQLVYSVYPAYKQWNRWLKDNGHILLARLPLS